MNLYLSAEFLAALENTGRTVKDVAAAVGVSAGYISSLRCGSRVPHTDGRNTVIAALCALVGFPEDRALTAVPPPRARRPRPVAAAIAKPVEPLPPEEESTHRDISPAEIERRYQAAKAEIRQRRARQ